MTLTNLRALRQEQALSMRDLAQRARISPATILRAEQGLPIYPTSVRKLAKALGVTPAALRGTPPAPLPEPVSAAPRRTGPTPERARELAARYRAEGDINEAEHWEQIAARIAAAVAAE